MKFPKLFAAAIFFVLLCSGYVDAQSNPSQSAPLAPTPAQTETASIYITAGTHKGIPIRDLKPEDITIREDKVPARIEKVTCGKPEHLLVGVVMDVSGSRRSDSQLLTYYDDLEAFLHRLLAGTMERISLHTTTRFTS